MPMQYHNLPLTIGAVLSFLAAVVQHLYSLGGRWLRFLGAGEPMARMSEAGHWYPPLMAFAIGAVLSVWGLYALSGAGLLPPLPIGGRFWRP
ncbi:MAG: hypothetical protein R3E56_14745 [Burkholderiaceae bacterium]